VVAYSRYVTPVEGGGAKFYSSEN